MRKKTAPNARILVASTSEVYGDPEVHPQTEEYWGHVNPVGPRGVYDEAKRFLESITMAYHNFHGVETRIIRIFNTYGPRQSARAVIPTIITQLLAGKTEIKLGALHPTRDLLFVKDTANGFVEIAKSESLIGHEVNIATHSEITVGDLAQNLINIINPSAKIITDDIRLRPEKSEVERLFGSNTKILEHTAWKQQYSLDEGLKHTIEWFSKSENLARYKADIYNV